MSVLLLSFPGPVEDVDRMADGRGGAKP